MHFLTYQIELESQELGLDELHKYFSDTKILHGK
jgi:hypothetical protein